ncbi:HAD family hydrolase [Natronoglomus mannanivorans]|uniref:HAD family hydrolase n=1 Tax=Natronoglomus mannanivorans TaxID=2979990 RepID=A0AAP3E3M3_9EURY|nr:HAD family hydrolase [Halobacteria archaeon AArc-xg1-1]
MSYDAVLFDFDGVLVEPPSSETLQNTLERVYDSFELQRPTPEEVSAFVKGNLEAISSRCQQLGVDTDRFCAQAAREAIRVQREELEAGMRSTYDDIAALCSLEASLGVVSDNHPTALSLVLQRVGVISRFETIHGCPFTPTGFERRKPNPHNLETALVALDVDPERALYVGDRDVDIEAADNAGVDSAHLTRDGSSIDRSPTHRLSSLRDLPAVVS